MYVPSWFEFAVTAWALSPPVLLIFIIVLIVKLRSARRG